MDAGALDVLHHAGNQHVLAVGDDVHLQLRAHEILVHQHGVFQLAGEDDLHIGLHILIVMGNDHVLPANDIAGAQQHRITQLVSRVQRAGQPGDAHAPRPLDGKALQQRVKPLPVLRHVDALGGGPQDGDALAVQKLGQLDGGLPAKGHHHAHGALHLDDVQHVLRAKRLEIQAVGGVVIRGDGLRVVVNDDHLVAQLLEGPHAVDRGVIKLNPLSDADGAGA